MVVFNETTESRIKARESERENGESEKERERKPEIIPLVKSEPPPPLRNFSGLLSGLRYFIPYEHSNLCVRENPSGAPQHSNLCVRENPSGAPQHSNR